MQTTTQNDQTSVSNSQPLDILQQFDGLLKNHSIVVTDRENLAKLFEGIVELCTQMPKTKLKAALKAATQAPKTKATPKTKTQPKSQTKTNTTNSKEIMVGPDGAADAPTIADLADVQSARGRGRPRKAATEIVTENPNPETAEKKRRGRPKKDKSVTISSNDDEDALIEKMMADVASMQKDEDHIPYPTAAAIEVAVTDAMTEVAAVEVTEVAAVAAPTVVMSDDDTDTDNDNESLSPIIQSTFAFHQEGEVEVEKDVVITLPTKPVKEVKAKPVKEVKAKPVKEVKVKPVKEVKAKPVKEVKAKANPVKTLASFSAPAPAPPPPVAVVASSQRHVENQEMNGGIYLTAGFPTSSFTWNGKTYLRTELDNVYDNLTYEMVGVWDHVNHEVICAFDEEDDGMYFSDEE